VGDSLRELGAPLDQIGGEPPGRSRAMYPPTSVGRGNGAVDGPGRSDDYSKIVKRFVPGSSCV
jgi:hypothetical protein